MGTQPWMKFYPSDWRSDPKLRMCSLGARGLWMEMLMLMHEATPYGHLIVAGRSPNDAQLAVLVGTTPDQIPSLLAELEDGGVFSRNGKGVIFSRRMTRDEKKSRTARKNGQNGGNPSLCKQTENSVSDNQEDKGGVNTQKPEARSQKPEREVGELKLSLETDNVVPLPARAQEASPRSLARQGMEIWNQTFADKTLPQIAKIDGPREKKFHARLTKDLGGDLQQFAHFCARVRSSPFLTGSSTSGWVADFDWCLEPAHFTKIIEGRYDERARQHAPHRDQQRGSAVWQAATRYLASTRGSDLDFDANVG